MMNVARALETDLLLEPDVPAESLARLAAHRPEGLETSLSPVGTPVTFANCVGLLYPGEGPLAVLMIGAIGYEEMCVRTTWRTLAERISAAGAPCLRFDLPGVGDSIGPKGEPENLDDWFEATRAAARFLRWATGCDRIVVVGQGIGGSIAARIARELAPVEATVFMAPVVSGKLYLRELSLWARMLTDRIGIPPDPDDLGGHAVAGLVLEAGRASAIKTIDLAKLEEAPSAKALVVARVNHGGDERFIGRLAELGVETTKLDYDGYEILATDPTQATPPIHVLDAVASWIADRAREVPVGSFLPRRAEPLVVAAAPTHGEGFRERPIRFGPGDRLFGVLTEPDQPNGRTVIFANAGRDYHIGWARATVDQARALARLGVASLRFDASGIGDSPAHPGASGELLYSQAQVDDLRSAVDSLEAMGIASPILVGRCSGAWAVFNAAVEDPRVQDVVMINTERFIWDPRENIAEALRYAHRSIGDFGATLWKRGGWRRLLKGQLRVAAAGKYVSQRLMRKASVKFAPVLGGLTHEGRLYREVHRRFGTLAKRRVAVWLIYSEGDLGLAELHTYFGEGGRRLSAYENVRRAMAAEADHNFTHKGARERLLAIIARVLAPEAAR